MAFSGSRRTGLTPGGYPGRPYSFTAKTALVIVPTGLVCARLSIEPSVSGTIRTEEAVGAELELDPAVGGSVSIEEC